MKRNRRINLDIQRLQRENEEQIETIRNLWDALDLPDNPQITNPDITKISSSPDVNREIGRLEQLLDKKKQEHANLEEQIRIYLENAEQYEEQLMRNQQEKAKLLNSFQRVVNNDQSNSELSISELESHVSELKSTRDKMKTESKKSKIKLNQVKKQIKKSKELFDQLESTIRQDQGDDDIEHILAEKKNIILELESKLANQNRLISRLQNDNQTLKMLIEDPDSES